MSVSVYQESGVHYDILDALKQAAQRAATETEENIPNGMHVVAGSRGESAFVIDAGPFHLATVQEGLGTKNLIADAIGTAERSYYDHIARDTVAMIVNDLTVVGAQPIQVNAHWALGGSEWLKQKNRGDDLIRGWADACNEAGAVFGAGETPMLPGIIYPATLELSGSAVGIIEPKDRLTLGDKLQAGDHIVLIESSGIHANGLTLARRIADELPEGYKTVLSGGQTFGETLLTPTHMYVKLQQTLFQAGADIHYMVHVTGHGWRKIMRANRELTYHMHTLPPPQEEFILMQQRAGISDAEMYRTFNMGAGYAFMVPESDAPQVMQQAQKLGFQSWDAGIVEHGPKQVIIEPKGIIFSEDTLRIR